MTMNVRPAAVAGRFYPGTGSDLEAAVDQYLSAATPQPLEKVRAIIAPHAGYIYSGPIAGYAYKALQSSLPPGSARIYLMGPAHRPWFEGVSTGNFGFATPLGIAEADEDALQALWKLESNYQPIPQAHQGEHSLEVQIPFLQRTIPQLALVPLLFGFQVDTKSVGKELAARLQAEADSRLVISSDLSHGNPYKAAQKLDRHYLEAVLAGDQRVVKRESRGACGRSAILALMQVAAELNWTPHLLDYRNSGDTAGPKWEVVGYAAVAYTAED